MKAALSKRLEWLAGQAWLHKSIRTLLVVAPGLGFFVKTGDQRGVMFAFAALCLSVPYGDHGFRPIHLAGCALLSSLLMPLLCWLQHYPVLYVPFIALAGIAYTLIRRSIMLPPRVPTWVLIYFFTRAVNFMELNGQSS